MCFVVLPCFCKGSTPVMFWPSLLYIYEKKYCSGLTSPYVSSFSLLCRFTPLGYCSPTYIIQRWGQNPLYWTQEMDTTLLFIKYLNEIKSQTFKGRCSCSYDFSSARYYLCLLWIEDRADSNSGVPLWPLAARIYLGLSACRGLNRATRTFTQAYAHIVFQVRGIISTYYR